jgi:tRNA-splicing ligase RtcB (3'-phosphate/5'-hydroxy nucleic acid ligase)
VKSGTATSGPAIRRWLAEARVSAKVQENLDRLARSEDVRHVVVLPDIHLGHRINNGCVVATADLVYPQAVGGDIGCGLSAIAFAGAAEALKNDRHAETVIKHLYRQVPALKQASALVLPDKLAGWSLSDDSLVKESRREGAWQFGTLGCGNHFVEFQQDDASVLWLMVHSGSRAMGQAITQFHLSRATPATSGLKYLDARSVAGRAYLNDMNWAVQYATLNRLAIMARIVEIIEAILGISANEDSYLDTVHNFARRERHSGKELIVHRKSANSAMQDEAGLVAGSMGSPSFLVQGLGNEASLCSSSHGAGRAMSRTEARQRIKPADIKQQLGAVQHDPRRLSELCDEAPGAYRDIRKVMQAQRDLVRQQARLSPVLNFKYPDRRVR